MTKPTEVRVTGPLAEYAAAFCDELATRGYTPLSAANLVRVMAHLSRWLASRRLKPEELSAERIEQFLRHRRRVGYTCWRSPRGLEPLVALLRRIGAVPKATPRPSSSPLDRVAAEYVDYLNNERALVDTTVRYRGTVARDFLKKIVGVDGSVARLEPEAVTRYVLESIRGYSIGTAGVFTGSVRSLLQFLHVRGFISGPLTGAVPKLAGWRQTAMPRALEPECVERILGACDRRTAVGRRDYAMLLLMVRLGLRAGEVASVRLNDFDWRRGEFLVHGKGGREERMPLPTDVGEALATYLRRGRPECGVRAVFVTHRAPHRALGVSSVSARVNWMSARAGFTLPISAHRLRHTAATEMLRKGSSLDDIAQVLRHRSTQTTAIYAKVDRESLRSLAKPWPRGES